MATNLTESNCWDFIDLAKWYEDPNYYRIQMEYLKILSEQEMKILSNFVKSRIEDLSKKYDKVVLEMPISEDDWFILKAEIIGRGKNFYETMTLEKLKKMIEENDYHENFLYSLHIGI